MASNITQDTRVEVDQGEAGRHETTWAQFCADNADGIDDAERMLIATTLAVDMAYRGGGGAQPAWTIRRAS